MPHASENIWNMYKMMSSLLFCLLSQCKGESIWKAEYLQTGSSCNKAWGAKFLSLLFHTLFQPPLCQPLNGELVLSVFSTLLSAIVGDSPTLQSACMSGLGRTKIVLISLSENFF